LIGDMFRNKIDLTYLPPDSDLVIHARVDETLGSPLAQSILAIPALKQALDKAADEFHVALADIKSITLGLSGVSEAQLSSFAPMPGMGMPGMGAPAFGAPGMRTAGMSNGTQNIHGIVVFRMSKNLPADLITKVPGYE